MNKIILIATMLAFSLSGEAEILECVDPDGSITFSNLPCPVATVKETTKLIEIVPYAHVEIAPAPQFIYLSPSPSREDKKAMKAEAKMAKEALALERRRVRAAERTADALHDRNKQAEVYYKYREPKRFYDRDLHNRYNTHIKYVPVQPKPQRPQWGK